jgi:hypothetical protein
MFFDNGENVDIFLGCDIMWTLVDTSVSEKHTMSIFSPEDHHKQLSLLSLVKFIYYFTFLEVENVGVILVFEVII